MEFHYHLPVNIIFGRGTVSRIGELAIPYGRRALIVTGHNSTKKSGLLDRVIHYLNKEGITCVVFDKVRRNPLTTTALEAAETARINQCEMVIGVGGGSVLDCAKAAAFMSVNDGDINDYIFQRISGYQALPILLIPTTCGTGSEGNGFAVLTNPETGDKKSLRCNAIVAKVSIIDSECMMTMPKSVLASVGYDALCHCMEAYISKLSQPMTDVICQSGMEAIGKYLIPVFLGEDCPEAWDALSLASTFGGMAIHSAGVTVAHGMEHPVSGLKDVVHGKGLAALTPIVMEKSLSKMSDKYTDIAKYLGGSSALDLPDRLRWFQSQLNLEVRLRDFGIQESDLTWLTDNCMKVSASGLHAHPVCFSQDEVYQIYEQAL